MKNLWIKSLRMLAAYTVLLGLAYPALVTLSANLGFPQASQGSLAYDQDGKVVGSALLAQEFKSPRFFWTRPSACNFETVPSGASNLSPAGAALKAAVDKRIEFLRRAHGLTPSALVPSDLVYASGSGLDPDISLEAALFQCPRVAKARRLDEGTLAAFIKRSARTPAFWLFGNTTVNVLALNRALDGGIN
jgi:potassium-transporting ATPase KdpC subunit